LGDGNGEVTADEIKEYIASIMGSDGDTSSLTMDDLDAVIEDMGIDLDSIATQAMDNALAALQTESNDSIDETQNTDETQKAQEAAKTQQTSNTGSTGSSGSSSGANSVNSGSSSSATKEKTLDNMSLSDLQAEKVTRDATLQQAQDDVNAVNDGTNANVKDAQEKLDAAQEDYNTKLENDSKVPQELKTQEANVQKSIAENEQAISENAVAITNKEVEISNQQNTVDGLNSSLSSLQSSLDSLPAETTGEDADEEKNQEIRDKRSSIEQQIADKEKEIEDAQKKLDELNEELDGENGLNAQKTKLMEEKENLQTNEEDIQTQISANCSSETKDAQQAYNDAKTNLESVKESELATATKALEEAQAAVQEVDAKINEVQNKETAKENSVAQFDFDFDENLTEAQQADLDSFKQNYEENKDRYEAVAEATGVPAELVAAIHWRESGGNFDTYLHNGDPLGSPTTHVPQGINYSNWEDAACDAMTRYIDQDKLDVNDINTYYDVAERYNGLGYRNKGQTSPYVWSGTSNYTSGKYVADGVYDSSAVDKQLGVAVMLKALMS
jgi:lysozyme family protein